MEGVTVCCKDIYSSHKCLLRFSCVPGVVLTLQTEKLRAWVSQASSDSFHSSRKREAINNKHNNKVHNVGKWYMPWKEREEGKVRGLGVQDLALVGSLWGEQAVGCRGSDARKRAEGWRGLVEILFLSFLCFQLFPMTQNMVWFVGLVLYNWFRFSFAEAH